MPIRFGGFPERKQIWPGAVLGSIVHAIIVSRYPNISNEQSWDGANYNVQDSMGSRGTIAFSGDNLVGVFFDERSPRNPFHSKKPYELNWFLKDIPASLHNLAYDEALQYVLQEYRGKIVPVITSAFWDDGENLTAVEPWEEVFANGAHLMRIQLLDTGIALKEWKSLYEMSSSEVALARSLFERKIAEPSRSIKLEVSERNILSAGAKGVEGTQESRESFAEIDIILP